MSANFSSITTTPTNGILTSNAVHPKQKVTATPPSQRESPVKAMTTDMAASPLGRRAFLEFLCILSVCILCYYNSLQCGLVFDDISAIRDNKDLRSTTPWRHIFLNDFWGTPMRKEHSHKSYRPLTVLTFRLNYWLHGLEPSGYHLGNVLLHITVCVLLKRMCRLLLQQCQQVRLNMQRINECSFNAALLFAVHPIHTEAVTGVVGRAELLSSIFFLLAFLSYARAVTDSTFYTTVTSRTKASIQHHQPGTRWLSLCGTFSACLLISMLSKEQGITVAGICAVYEILVVQQLRPHQLWHYFLSLFDEREGGAGAGGKRGNSSPSSIAGGHKRSSPLLWTTQFDALTMLKRLGFLIFVTVALLILRVSIMGSQLPVFTRFDNPASVADTPQRQLTYAYLIFLNLWLLLFPHNLCCDWTMGTIPLIEGFADPRNLLTFLTFTGLVGLVLRSCFTSCLKQSRVVLMGLAFLILPFVPASNLFFPVGFVVAERILYIPSMGFCLLVAYGLQCLKLRCSRSAKILLKLTFLLLVVTHVMKTHARNEDWRTEYSLFISGVKVNPRNAKLFNNVGHALENQGLFKEALEYFQRATEIQEDDIGAHINVGRTYNNLKMYEKAEAAYLKAKSLFPKIKPGESYQARIAPNHLNVFINLANLISRNNSRLEEADKLYKQAISMRADYVQAYINRGDILMKLNRSAEAQKVYEKALFYDSENADIYYNLGVVFLEQGKHQQAHAYFNKAIDLYPQHEQALLNSAIMLQEMGGPEHRRISRERLYRVLELDERNERAHFNLGMLAMDEENYQEAEDFFKRAIHLKENFRSALFNLALMLADTKRPMEAVPYLNQLIHYHPDHIKALILLGDIYVNHMRDLDAAESCYRNILKYEPHNVQGVHNLCVVFVERKRLLKAAACLKFAHHLAPNEDYIKRHFNIVQAEIRNVAKLPDDSPEKRQAFGDYDPGEFSIEEKAEPSIKKDRSQEKKS